MRVTIARDPILRPLDVEATAIFGEWAVHNVVGLDDEPVSDRWTVTHIPSGRSVCLRTISDNETTARRLAEALHWGITPGSFTLDERGAPQPRVVAQAIVDIINRVIGLDLVVQRY